jgi:hypothetical protein
LGKTGMIIPKPITSIKRVTKIKPIAALADEAIKFAVEIIYQFGCKVIVFGRGLRSEQVH